MIMVMIIAILILHFGTNHQLRGLFLLYFIKCLKFEEKMTAANTLYIVERVDVA